MKKIKLLLLGILILLFSCNSENKNITDTMKVNYPDILFSITDRQLLNDSYLSLDSANYMLEYSTQNLKEVSKLHLMADALTISKLNKESLKRAIALENEANTILSKSFEKYKIAHNQIFNIYLKNLDVISKTLKSDAQSKVLTYRNKAVELSSNKQSKANNTINRVINYENMLAAISNILNAYLYCEQSDQREIIRTKKYYEFTLNYRIKIGNSNDQYKAKELKLKYSGKDTIFQDINHQRYRYTIGRFKSYQQAKQAQRQLKMTKNNIVAGIGGIVYNNKIKSIPERKTNVIFRIQVTATQSKITKEELQKYTRLDTNLYIETEKGLHKYMIGKFATYDQAAKFKLDNKLENTFIVKFNKNTNEITNN